MSPTIPAPALYLVLSIAWKIIPGLYAAARDDQICGDASPSYLYTHATSIANLQRVYAQQADYQRLKFIISLRNPAERAWSQYWTLQRRQEDPLDFDQAIKT